MEWINEAGNGMTEDFMRYITPLVSGAAATVGDDLPHWPRLTKFPVDKKLTPYAPAK